ncbi:MAG: helix-turn-helix domain-containing protein [Lachnospiraceae bacterium]|nr:helix-turn-helix domain-containing protein [Lachnospiraceae bacterium]
MVTLSMICEHFAPDVLDNLSINPDEEINSVRIRTETDNAVAGVLYLFPDDEGVMTGCGTINGSSFLVKEHVYTTFNKVLEVFEYYRNWEDRLLEACRRGCTLTELLNMSYSVIPYPMLILDCNEWMIAHTTAFDDGKLGDNWNYIVEHATMPIAVLAKYNQEFYDFFEKRGVYKIPGSIFPRDGYAYNFFVGNTFCGVIGLVDHSGTITPGIGGAFAILCAVIQDFIGSSTLNLAFSSPGQPLADYIARAEDKSYQKLIRALDLALWGENDKKMVLYAAPSPLRSLAPNPHNSRLIFSRWDGVIVANYQDGLVLLCDIDVLSKSSSIDEVYGWLNQISYYVGASNTFTDVSKVQSMFHQAKIALEYGNHEVGCVNEFENHIMPYLVSLVEKGDESILNHSCLTLLEQYDKRHGSSLYETLFVFLKNERRLKDTAAELNVHRGTLIHRLQRLDELLPVSLEQPEVRMYLLLSYYADGRLEEEKSENKFFALQ